MGQPGVLVLLVLLEDGNDLPVNITTSTAKPVPNCEENCQLLWLFALFVSLLKNVVVYSLTISTILAGCKVKQISQTIIQYGLKTFYRLNWFLPG